MSYQTLYESTRGSSQLNRIRKGNKNVRIGKEEVNYNLFKKMI